MVTVKDIAWIAGILEGEGSFSWQNTPRIQVASIDFDVINRVGYMINKKIIIKIKSSKSGYNKKKMYYFQANGSEAAQWMMTIYCLMSDRRKEKIKWVLSNWRQMNGKWGRLERFIPEVING